MNNVETSKVFPVSPVGKFRCETPISHSWLTVSNKSKPKSPPKADNYDKSDASNKVIRSVEKVDVKQCKPGTFRQLSCSPIKTTTKLTVANLRYKTVINTNIKQNYFDLKNVEI